LDNKQLAKKLKNISDTIDGVKPKGFKLGKLLSKVIAADSIRVKSDTDNDEPIAENSKVAKKKKKSKKDKAEETVEEVVEQPKKKKGKKKKAAEATAEKSTKKNKKNKKSKKKDSEDTTEKSTKKKKGKKKKAAEAEAAPKSGADKFGCRKGTIKAQINKALTKKYKTMATILEETGIENPQTGHLNDLVKRELVIKGDKGYKLA
jgi:hypothetical protein